MRNVQSLFGNCQGVPHSGKQSYFDIALIFHDTSMRGELFKPDCYKNLKQKERLRAVEEVFLRFLPGYQLCFHRNRLMFHTDQVEI